VKNVGEKLEAASHQGFLILLCLMALREEDSFVFFFCLFFLFCIYFFCVRVRFGCIRTLVLSDLLPIIFILHLLLANFLKVFSTVDVGLLSRIT
jgi:hypothetical protein